MGVPCWTMQPKPSKNTSQTCVPPSEKIGGPGERKLLRNETIVIPPGRQPAAKNLVIFPQKSGKMTNLFDAKFSSAPTGVPSDILRTRPRRASGGQGAGAKPPAKRTAG